MGAVDEVRKVAVNINIIGVVTACTVHRIVTSIIGAVGVGIGKDEDVEIVHQVDDAVISAGTQLVDQTEHENHACYLIAMHGGGVEELRFAVGVAVVDAHAQQFATRGQRTKFNAATAAAQNGLFREALHHRNILVVGRIGVPCLALPVPHGMGLSHGGRHLQERLVACLNHLVILPLVGIAGYNLAVGLVNGADTVDGSYLRRVIDADCEIILTATAHELRQLCLFLCTNCATDNGNAKDEDIT